MFMAKKIGQTPVLEGEDAEIFLKKMNEPVSEEDKKYWKEVESQRNVPF